MEGEPTRSKDAVLLASSAQLVINGLAVAAGTVGATDAYLAAHRGSPVIDGLLNALDERDSAQVQESGSIS